MTKDEINRAMADKVMGWKFEHGYPGDFYSRDGTIVFWVNDWKPDERVDHAMMCLDKFPIWKITRFPDSNYECVIGVGKGYKGGAIDTELARTISLATLEAVKEGENELS